MNQTQLITTVYSAVKIVDESLERHGQVGSYLGPAETAGESIVRFDDADEVFPNASLQVL